MIITFWKTVWKFYKFYFYTVLFNLFLQNRFFGFYFFFLILKKSIFCSDSESIQETSLLGESNVLNLVQRDREDENFQYWDIFHYYFTLTFLII